MKNVVEFAAYTCDRGAITNLPLPKSQPESHRIDDSILSAMSGPGALKKLAADTQRAVIRSMLNKYGDTLEAWLCSVPCTRLNRIAPRGSIEALQAVAAISLGGLL